MLEIIITCIIGTLLHFTYEWSNKNKVIGIFSAINESTAEHIKIGLTPMIILSIIDYFFIGKNPNYIFSKFVLLSSFIIVLILLYYSYKLLLKKNILFLDIMIFYVSIIISYVFSFYVLKYNTGNFNSISIIGIILILIGYFTFTYNPPKCFLFKDPLK